MTELRKQILNALRDNAKSILKDDCVTIERVFIKDVDSVETICNDHADKVADERSIGFGVFLRTECEVGIEAAYWLYNGKSYLEDDLLKIYKETLTKK